jgi:hypothetical protein
MWKHTSLFQLKVSMSVRKNIQYWMATRRTGVSSVNIATKLQAGWLGTVSGRGRAFIFLMDSLKCVPKAPPPPPITRNGSSGFVAHSIHKIWKKLPAQAYMIWPQAKTIRRSWQSLKGTGICFQTVNRISISSSTSSYSVNTPNTSEDINLTLVVKKPKFNGRKKQTVEIMLKLKDKIKPDKKVDKCLKK